MPCTTSSRIGGGGFNGPWAIDAPLKTKAASVKPAAKGLRVCMLHPFIENAHPKRLSLEAELPAEERERFGDAGADGVDVERVVGVAGFAVLHPRADLREVHLHLVALQRDRD